MRSLVGDIVLFLRDRPRAVRKHWFAGIRMKVAVAGMLLVALSALVASPSCAQTGARSTTAYSEGRAARQAWEEWFSPLKGDFRAGAAYWAGNRATGVSQCNQSRFSAEFARGCRAAKDRLDQVDKRRNSEADFRRGWNAPPAPVRTKSPGSNSSSLAVPSWWIDAGLAVLAFVIAAGLIFGWAFRKGMFDTFVMTGPAARSLVWKWLLYWIPVGVIWLAGILLAAACVTALHFANYDFVRLDPIAGLLPLLGIGFWWAMRDGRRPLWRLGVLVFWAVLVLGWTGLAVSTWILGSAAVEAGFTAPHPSRLVLLALILVAAIRVSGWLYMIGIAEWTQNAVTGEWHRVLRRSRGYLLLDQRTWEQRRNEELYACRERRMKLFPQAGLLALSVIGGLYIWLHFSDLPFFWSTAILIIAVVMTTGLVYAVIRPLSVELLYQTGFQYMTGAKVFDRRPKSKTQPFGIPPRYGADDEHSGSRMRM